MASATATATEEACTAEEGPKFDFMSLPRELRDTVYEPLVVTSKPIRFDPIFGPLAYDIQGLNLLYGWDTLQQITQEACEIFYQRNVFEVYSDDIPLLLSTLVHQWALHDHPDSREWWRDSPPRQFDTKLHVMNLKVIVSEYRRSVSLADDLRCLLSSDRMQNVTVEFRWFTWRDLDDEAKMVVEGLQRKIGGRLKVHVEGVPRDRAVEYMI